MSSLGSVNTIGNIMPLVRVARHLGHHELGLPKWIIDRYWVSLYGIEPDPVHYAIGSIMCLGVRLVPND